jgi:hypothetical protein
MHLWLARQGLIDDPAYLYGMPLVKLKRPSAYLYPFLSATHKIKALNNGVQGE